MLVSEVNYGEEEVFDRDILNVGGVGDEGGSSFALGIALLKFV